MTEIEKLLDIMARLRDPDGGCPWDLEQTFATIAPYTIEEAYEVADAIAREAWHELPDELGDLLLQVVFHAQMASEEGRFNFDDVAAAINAKMVRRHPHVFADDERGDAELQLERWEVIKAEERAANSPVDSGALDGVAVALPELQRAEKLGKRAARVGFDWDRPGAVRQQIDLELSELDAEMDVEPGVSPAADRLAEELGDVLFSVTQLARHLDVDAAAALRGANQRFEARFRAMEQALKAAGKSPDGLTAADWEAEWQAAKARLAGDVTS